MREFRVLAILAAVASLAGSSAQAAESAVLCHNLNLSPTATTDCEQQLGKALTDKDRAKVIRTFATGMANTKADAMISQLSSSPTAGRSIKPARAAAPAARSQKVSATPVPEVATPQQKATAASGGDRTGTAAKAEHTTQPANQPIPKAKGQKALGRPATKTVKKTIQ